MLRLGLIFHLFIGSTFAGSAVVAALALGQDTAPPIVLSALVGFVISVPVSLWVAKTVLSNIK